MGRLLLAAVVIAIWPVGVAQADAGYLHKADAQTSATRYATGSTTALGASSAALGRCERRAERVVDCGVVYGGIAFGASPGWVLTERVRITLHAGRVRVTSLLFG